MSFYGVTDMWTYVVGAFGIILLPGPNSLFVLSVATARGVKAGYQGAMGVFVGDTIVADADRAGGSQPVARPIPPLFMVVKYAGAAYLAWVGLNLLWAAIQKWRSAQMCQRHRPTVTRPRPSGAPLQAGTGHQPAESQGDLVFAVVFCAVH
jgi:leucine efflux protein